MKKFSEPIFCTMWYLYKLLRRQCVGPNYVRVKLKINKWEKLKKHKI